MVKPASLMKKMIGIVGFGEMGKRHGLEFRQATKGLVEIAGVVEPSDDMYRRGCEWNQMSIPRYASVAEMLDRCDLDGALITSPNHCHLENLREFDGRTMPILLEKPLDSSLDKVAEIVRFAESYQGTIVVDHVMRYAPIIRRARQIVEEGRLGRLASFQFTQRTSAGAFHTFRRSLHGGGSQMIEKATHDLDVLLFLCGALPRRVAMISRQQFIGGDKPNNLRCFQCEELLKCPGANLERDIHSANKDIDIGDDLCIFAKAADVPDNEACLIELDNGVFGTYSHSYFYEMKGHSRLYELIGLDGAMTLQLSAEDPRYRGILRYFPREKNGEVETYEYDYFGRIHYNGGPYLARHFYDLMCGTERSAFTTVNQAFVAEAIGFAAMKAAREDCYVPVDSIIPPDLREAYLSAYRKEPDVPAWPEKREMVPV